VAIPAQRRARVIVILSCDVVQLQAPDSAFAADDASGIRKSRAQEMLAHFVLASRVVLTIREAVAANRRLAG
jgi:hypothetical protein